MAASKHAWSNSACVHARTTSPMALANSGESSLDQIGLKTDMTKTNQKKEDENLKRMLKTPPKPHKKGKANGDKHLSGGKPRTAKKVS